MERLLYRPEDAAQVLGIGRSKVFELMAAGQLRSVQLGRSRRIPESALRDFVAELEGRSPAA